MTRNHSEFKNLLLASRAHTDAFGFFCSREAAVGLSSPHVSFTGDVEQFLRRVSDHEERVRTALGSVSYFHELRHVHDLFGTIGGMGAFFAWISLARHFVRLTHELRSTRQRWHLPLTSWFRKSDCPSIVREFLQRARVMGSALLAYNGNIDDNTVEDCFPHDPDVIYELRTHPDLQFGYPVGC